MDYERGPYPVVFPVNSLQMSYTILVTDDDILEIDEAFNISINSTSLPLDVFIGNISQAVVVIVDEDRKYMSFFVCWNNFIMQVLYFHL